MADLGQHLEALPVFRDALSKRPDDPELLWLTGYCEVSLGMLGPGKAKLHKGVKIKPTDPRLYNALALAYRRERRLDLAKQALTEAIRVAPDNHASYSGLAEMLFLEDDFEGADRVLQSAIDRGVEGPFIWLALSQVRRHQKRYDEGIALLQRTLEVRVSHSFRVGVLFRMAEMYDRAGRYDDAFAAFERANKEHESRFVAGQHRRLIDRTIAAWTPEAVARLPRARKQIDGPVFIVGMPRSGTSMVEQIISCLPGVAPGGELPIIPEAVSILSGAGIDVFSPMVEDPAKLTPAAVNAIATRCLGQYRAIDPKAKFVTDKLPGNVLYLGIIYALLPDARVIHVRRDERDTCVSCFTKHFGANLGWSSNLRDMASFCVDCRRIFEHWKRVLPMPIYEVRYEELVADLEGQTRKMLDAVGLPWDPACLRFWESDRVVFTASNEQVRQPVYKTSLGKWRRFEKHLGPLVEGLAAGGITFDD